VAVQVERSKAVGVEGKRKTVARTGGGIRIKKG
jgi:hypothetical protein